MSSKLQLDIYTFCLQFHGRMCRQEGAHVDKAELTRRIKAWAPKVLSIPRDQAALADEHIDKFIAELAEV